MAELFKAKIGKTIVDLVQGDITKEKVDAIVNAANTSLLGGGGVDGAIHRAAGKDLLEECRKLNGCGTGEAKITKGYLLPAKHVIHAVGPIYYMNSNSPELLANAHHNSLKLAQENGLKSVAFPAISTGVYGYPMDKAAHVAINSVADYVKQKQPDFELLRFVLFDARALQTFAQAFAEIVEKREDFQ
jgi:O-acetyl-ADP-ribose deacetylase (regulator of RNase III)